MFIETAAVGFTDGKASVFFVRTFWLVFTSPKVSLRVGGKGPHEGI